MDKAEDMWTASIHFSLDITRTDKALLVRLHDILQKHPGSCNAYIHLLNPEKTETIIAIPDTMKLKAGTSLTREINRCVGYDAVNTVCSPIVSSSKSNGFSKNNQKR